MAEHVAPRKWDAAERASARQLDQMEPAWCVMYGVGSRRFYAIATWHVLRPLIVQARAVEELRTLMREAERAASSPPVVPSLVPSQTSVTAWRTPPSLPGAPMPATSDGLRTVCWDLPDDLSVIGEARRLVGHTLAAWRLGHLTDDVILVVDEFLANAVTHGEPPIRLSLWGTPAELCVRVTDHGADLPRHLDLGIDAVHGRGLIIVAALADEHGVTPLAEGPGKSVWARWRQTTRSGGDPHAASVTRTAEAPSADNV
ncbi:ATP-binding protein [Sphaerisporangium siamense]|uniref:Anti-sigma regulatory factor (Ser/Thr protein kinase) n=1 Tax=Sphaerisporangium siamense TaxID=795645 RepID=A0A7W7G9S8_9ACTN|nr:ATP-binding protein [Sphaerisporangium siamense]MBB4700809.1 anti-sigma regulatory factor (Ser/Thr protein kinase) [Sphaerisporangium siamense]